MIIYGINGTHLLTTALPHEPCPACNVPGHLAVSVFSRYFHIYAIPLLPYSKPVAIQCQRCQQVWDDAVPAALQTPIRELKRDARAPWWHWVGLVLVGLGIAWGVTTSTRNAQQDDTYLKSPQAGDIYTVRDDENATDYSLLKVVSAKGNTVEVVANEYSINNSEPLQELNAPFRYSKESFSLTLLELQIMHNKGQLTDVHRLAAE